MTTLKSGANNYYLGSYGPDGKNDTDDDVDPPINPCRHSFNFDRINKKALEITKIISSKDSSNTIVVPYLEEAIKPGKNLLFCNTFQLAWNEAGNAYLVNNNLKIVQMLNKKMVSKDDLSPDSYVAVFGLFDEIADKLNKSMKDKFGDDAPILKREEFGNSNEVLKIAYAYLYKNLQFEKEFGDIAGGMPFKNKRVLAFGVCGYLQELHGDLGKQVNIFDYKGVDDFIILLKSKSANDDIVLVKTPPKGTLLDMVNDAEWRIKKSKPEDLKHADSLYVPEMNFDIKHDYKELVGNGSNIFKAFQETRFRLNKKGAEVRSIAEIGSEEDGGYERKFVFDKPFLIYLKEKTGKYPYLAIWIDNPELLVEFEHLDKH
ncbi:MAG: hypothetical protein A2328_02845 [Bdellovibrionales bacterium RIFOXYB2_FULL_36_6]|nr:MAG: hypothetical protein A2328_02845 [Bdellovibrionales bacterium RIFOXYB2_FULL_36_6]